MKEITIRALDNGFVVKCVLGENRVRVAEVYCADTKAVLEAVRDLLRESWEG